MIMRRLSERISLYNLLLTHNYVFNCVTLILIKLESLFDCRSVAYFLVVIDHTFPQQCHYTNSKSNVQNFSQWSRGLQNKVKLHFHIYSKNFELTCKINKKIEKASQPKSL